MTKAEAVHALELIPLSNSVSFEHARALCQRLIAQMPEAAEPVAFLARGGRKHPMSTASYPDEAFVWEQEAKEYAKRFIVEHPVEPLYLRPPAPAQSAVPQEPTEAMKRGCWSLALLR